MPQIVRKQVAVRPITWCELECIIAPRWADTDYGTKEWQELLQSRIGIHVSPEWRQRYFNLNPTLVYFLAGSKCQPQNLALKSDCSSCVGLSMNTPLNKVFIVPKRHCYVVATGIPPISTRVRAIWAKKGANEQLECGKNYRIEEWHYQPRALKSNESDETVIEFWSIKLFGLVKHYPITQFEELSPVETQRVFRPSPF